MSTIEERVKKITIEQLGVSEDEVTSNNKRMWLISGGLITAWFVFTVLKY